MSADGQYPCSNGGAGALGLVGALATDYLSTLDHEAAITWVCNHSRNTQLALKDGYIDIALTYERDQEQISIDEGWAVSGDCIFHDHFCLAGPIGDPAGVRSASSVHGAFRRIAEAKSSFTSRADSSATMIKERSIWKSIGLEPWKDNLDWYIQTLFSPAEAIRAASAKGTYLLTDRSSLLHQTSQGKVQSISVFFEPEDESSILMNSCFALFDPNAEPGVQARVNDFLSYMKSNRGQGLIARYGCMESGLPFFAAVDARYARDSIVGGQPVDRQWRTHANARS